MGVLNLNQIAYGIMCSASIGYYMGAGYFAHSGYMHEAIRGLLHYAFSEKNLHRIEANIQPGNHYSKRLVRKLRFRNEGFSPKYLYICGEMVRSRTLCHDSRRLCPKTHEIVGLYACSQSVFDDLPASDFL